MPLPDPALLPDDPAILKALVVQLLEELRQAHARLERQEHHMHLLLKRIYGSTSEKFDPRQGVLFDAQTGAEEAALGGAENLVELPPETSEQLDWRPSTLFVVVHVRKKYARKEQLPESGLTLAEQNVVVAKKPPEAIPGSLAGPGLMAQVIVSKGADHLPLHRLEGIFQRQGVKLSRQTMDGWWLQTAEFLRPLYTLAVQVVLASHVLHTDDTPVQVRDAWLEAEAPKVLPKSAVRGAMDYTLSNWAALSIYPDDGWLDIDNNEGENSLRGLCLGRKNWLFFGNDRGGRAAAVHFSLLASCKRHGHDPWVYLRDVLIRLPAMPPGASDEELLALLPHRWQPA